MDPFKPYEPRPKAKIPKLSAEDAEAIALQAMTYIAADDVLITRFIGLTAAAASTTCEGA